MILTLQKLSFMIVWPAELLMSLLLKNSECHSSLTLKILFLQLSIKNQRTFHVTRTRKKRPKNKESYKLPLKFLHRFCFPSKFPLERADRQLSVPQQKTQSLGSLPWSM